MFGYVNDELKENISATFKAKQIKEEAQKRADFEQKIKRSTSSFSQLIRTEYDHGSRQRRIGIVHRKDGEEKVFFKNDIVENGFIPVLIPYRG